MLAHYVAIELLDQLGWRPLALGILLDLSENLLCFCLIKLREKEEVRQVHVVVAPEVHRILVLTMFVGVDLLAVVIKVVRPSSKHVGWSGGHKRLEQGFWRKLRLC